jgi:hypothetical protein
MAQTHEAVVARIVAEEYLHRRVYIVNTAEISLPDSYAFTSFDMAVRHYFQMMYDEFRPNNADDRTPFEQNMMAFIAEISKNDDVFANDGWKQLFIEGLTNTYLGSITSIYEINFSFDVREVPIVELSIIEIIERMAQL